MVSVSVVHVAAVLNSPPFQKVLPDVLRAVERCIRLSRAQPNYRLNVQHCLYGLTSAF